MSIGAMRHRVDLQQRTRTSDGGGGVVSSWGTTATVWASMTPKTGIERFKVGQIESPITHIFRIRYRSDFDSTWRIKYGARLFNVLRVLNVDERSAYLDVMASEGVGT
jgi:SPP1 family predicted phage head-tail adaptor